ncbi:hypothetical protein BKH46_08870 [Helicobacter sp. 12S02634-8]|uniref:hypothetical protein n=1 Tax=Helicobacter sp. 12S02634-8 TaxID=1476199 RepID=UPI000BA6C520|nr:hypothetical protein [Helicobacter sp. 12S02634-8]PAF46148.1 hypothetical protein BKH46_08870 [Helicobacter sp. 12S02634-8]
MDSILLSGLVGFLGGMVSVSVILFLILNERISFLLSEVNRIEKCNWDMFIKIMKVTEKSKDKKEAQNTYISEIEREVAKNKKKQSLTELL